MTRSSRVALTVVPSLFNIASGAGKLAEQEKSVQIREKIGITDSNWKLLGAAEAVLGVGSLVGLASRRLELASKGTLMLMNGMAVTLQLRKGNTLGALPDAASLALLAASTRS